MDSRKSLDEVLSSLGGSGAHGLPADFMDGVWQRAGEFEAARDNRRRLALFFAVFVTALGSGYWTFDLPRASEPTYEFVSAMEYSPATLLHADS